MTLTTEDMRGWLPQQPRRAPSIHPIGHGPLADAAAEPIEFTRLLQHLEREHLVNDWTDTMPSGPTPLDEHPSAWPERGGSCAKPARLFWTAICITCAAVFVGLLLAWII